MKKREKGKNTPAIVNIRQTHQSVSEPTVHIKARVLTEEQLRIFLKDIWDFSCRETWWNRAEKVLIFIMSLCIPELFHWGLDTFSKDEKIDINSFLGVSFLLPFLGLLFMLLLFAALRFIRNQINKGSGEKAFIETNMNKFPMNMEANIAQTDFKAYTPLPSESRKS